LARLRFQFAITRIGLFLLFVMSAGCSFLAPAVQVAEVPVVQPVTPPEVVPEPEPLPVQVVDVPAPRVVIPEPPSRPAHTAVVISDDIPAFTGVAEQIKRRLGEEHVSIHNLDGLAGNRARVAAEIGSADQVVAVGLLAATVGRRSTDRPLVFCKVFNYQDYDLISPLSKGVNFLPPFEMQLEAWTNLAPGLRSVGVIAGPGQEALVEEVRQAAASLQVSLAFRSVESDKEALVTFKRLTPDVQGFWLLPDNRILSPEVVREIMSYSAKHRKQVVVFGSNLLGLGAVMSITSNDEDVVDQVLRRLSEVTDDGKWPGPDMAPLTKMELQINPDVAGHFGIAPAEQVARIPGGG
jgi:ABC-type uncharacterized transport system substrate-binding protein